MILSLKCIMEVYQKTKYKLTILLTFTRIFNSFYFKKKNLKYKEY